LLEDITNPLSLRLFLFTSSVLPNTSTHISRMDWH